MMANARRSAIFATQSLGVLFLLALLCSGCAHARQSTAGSVSLVYDKLSLGLCEDYPASTRSIEKTRADLLLLKTNDVRFLRTAIAWDALEPRPGFYDWQFLDALVDNAHQLGITLIPYVCYTPEWAARDTNAFWTQPPRNFQDYKRVVKNLAERYKGRINSWEIWNEPDNREYWAGSVQEYAELLKLGSEAVREGNPNAQVVSGGLAWDLGFLRTLLEQPGVRTAVDVVNLHNYYETWSEDGVEDIARYVNRASRILDKLDMHRPIWLAELGYSTFRTNKFVSDAYEARYRHEHTPEFQASTLFRMLVPLMSSTRVRLAAWYRIHDLPGTVGVIGDVNNRHLGIVFTNSQAKPAMAALQFFKQLFEDGFAPVDDRLYAAATLDSWSEVHGFLTKDGSLVVVAWLKVVEPERMTSAHVVREQERLLVAVPGEFSSEGNVYNETGQQLGKLPVQRKTRFAEIILRSGELRVLTFKRR